MSDFFAHGLGVGLAYLAVAFLLSVVLEPLGIRLAWRLGVVDRPVGDKIHARTTPLMGGVAVAAAFLVAAIVWGVRHGAWANGNRQLTALLIGCALAVALGICDEVFKLKPGAHFLGQILVVALALLVGFPAITSLSNPLHGFNGYQSGSFYFSALLGFAQAHLGHDPAPLVSLAIGVPFTLFWIVGMMNTINFLDGLDGLAGGVSGIAALFLGLWSVAAARNGFPTHDNQNVVLALILCGALLGFLVYNWTPARVFMGDSGAMFTGFALGALSIFGQIRFGTALLILIVPIVDVAWAIVRRLLGRRSFASGDKHHIYHRMVELGLSRRAVVLLFYALCLGLGVIDLNLAKAAKLLAFAIVAVLTAAGAVALEVRGRRAQARTTTPARELRLPASKR